MKRMSTIAFFATLILNTALFGFDAKKAEELQPFYGQLTHKACANSTMFIDAATVMQHIRDNTSMVLLDIRTKGETGVVALTAKQALQIPVAELFDKKNLDRLPTDRPIIIVCYSGTRAVMAAVGLKQVGFKNIQVLKGGIVALATANSVKNAPMGD